MGRVTEYVYRFNASWWKRIIIFVFLIIITSSILNVIYTFEGQHPYNLFFSVLIATLIIETLRSNGAWYSFGARIDRFALRDITAGFCLALFPMLLIILVGVLIGADYQLNLTKFNFGNFNSITSLILITAATEELLFRGLIFQTLIERFSTGAIIIIFSLLFSFGHSHNPNIATLAYINIFLAGLLISLMYLKTLSLWLPISFHFFWNWMQDAIISLPVSGIEFGIELSRLSTEKVNKDILFIIGGNFGIEQGLLTTIILITLIYIITKFFNPSPYMSSRIFKRKYSESLLISKSNI